MKPSLDEMRQSIGWVGIESLVRIWVASWIVWSSSSLFNVDDKNMFAHGSLVAVEWLWLHAPILGSFAMRWSVIGILGMILCIFPTTLSISSFMQVAMRLRSHIQRCLRVWSTCVMLWGIARLLQAISAMLVFIVFGKVAALLGIDETYPWIVKLGIGVLAIFCVFAIDLIHEIARAVVVIELRDVWLATSLALRVLQTRKRYVTFVFGLFRIVEIAWAICVFRLFTFIWVEQSITWAWMIWITLPMGHMVLRVLWYRWLVTLICVDHSVYGKRANELHL